MIIIITKHLSVELVDTKSEEQQNISVPLKYLSDKVLYEIAPIISEAAVELAGGIDRGLARISGILMCPSCKEKLIMHTAKKHIFLL